MCVPLSTFLQPAELARVVRHADLHGLVGTRTFLGRDFAEQLGLAFPSLGAAGGPTLALPEAPFLRFVALEDGSPEPWCTAHGAIAAAGGDPVWADVLAGAEAEVHPDDEAIVICTSGQSAEPKGVVHVHGAILEKVHYLRDMYQFERGVQCQILLPFFWVGGLTMGLLPAMEVGGVAVCTDRSTWGSGQVVGAAIEQENPYGGMRMEPTLGMTETFGIYSWGEEWRVPGHPLCAPIDALQPGFEIRVVDEAGNPVADGERGEVLLRGPTVARRLNKVRRSEVFDADGFYRTGDQVERDGARYHFTGRISDMIKTSGANVSPAEVERELLAFDEVEIAHVVAIDDAARDQVVGAAVVLAAGASLTATEIRRATARTAVVVQGPAQDPVPRFGRRHPNDPFDQGAPHGAGRDDRRGSRVIPCRKASRTISRMTATSSTRIYRSTTRRVGPIQAACASTRLMRVTKLPEASWITASTLPSASRMNAVGVDLTCQVSACSSDARTVGIVKCIDFAAVAGVS